MATTRTSTASKKTAEAKPNEVEALKIQIAQMEEKNIETSKKLDDTILMLQSLIGAMQSNKVVSEQNTEIAETTEPVREQSALSSVPEQPRPDELIKVMSLRYGVLNLNVNDHLALRLDKYCEIKPVLYSNLIDIVNQNRSFAEYGYFYILDDRAVYHLGLSDCYKNLVSGDVMNHIDAYSDSQIKQILDNVRNEQKDTIVYNLCLRLYKDEPVDANKIRFIGNVCGVDIFAKVREMHELDKNIVE